MNLKSLSAALLFASTSFLAVACGGADDADPNDGASSESDVIKGAKVTPGSFKLYASPDHEPNPGCDVHTKLTLSADPRNSATLVEAVGGFCEIAVIPNERTYNLRLTATPCGSKEWSGILNKGGKRTEIKITDHRSRMCMDMVAGVVEVEEKQADGTVVKKWGNPETSTTPPAGQAMEVTGTFVSTVGIGGENTGRSIKTEKGLYELVLDGKEVGQFSENATARIRGKLTYLSGVETHDRPAIDVSDILTCPNVRSVNCMPPTTNALCKGDTRSWIQASCPGVEYLD